MALSVQLLKLPKAPQDFQQKLPITQHLPPHHSNFVIGRGRRNDELNIVNNKGLWWLASNRSGELDEVYAAVDTGGENIIITPEKDAPEIRIEGRKITGQTPFETGRAVNIDGQIIFILKDPTDVDAEQHSDSDVKIVDSESGN